MNGRRPSKLAGELSTWITSGSWLEGATILTTGPCRPAIGSLGAGLSPSPMDRRCPKVRSVGAVDDKGRLYGAWTVREHGYDGEGPVDGRESLKNREKTEGRS